MSAIHVVMLGSSSANEFGPITGTASLLRTRLQSVRTTHCRVTKVAQNGIGLIEQCPTGYTVPSTLSGIVTVNTSLNITFALGMRPYAVILWQPAANMPEYEAAPVSFTQVSQYESVIESEMLPAILAIKAACDAAKTRFFAIGSHTATAAGKDGTLGTISDARMTGTHRWDIRMREVLGPCYIDGGWDRYSVGTAYNNPTQETAVNGTMDAATGGHFTAATAQDHFDAFIKDKLGLETDRLVRQPAVIAP